MFDRLFAASGVSDAQTEERTYSAAGRDYPDLYTYMTLTDIPASASLICIEQDNRVLYLSCTTRGEGHFEEFRSLITHDEANKGRFRGRRQDPRWKDTCSGVGILPAPSRERNGDSREVAAFARFG